MASASQANATEALFRRRLTALGHFDPNNFDSNDQNQFRQCVLWLEDQHVRNYTLEDRTRLREASKDKGGEQWKAAWEKYLRDVQCPSEVPSGKRKMELMWLLGHAIQRTYLQDPQQYNKLAEDAANRSESQNEDDPLGGRNPNEEPLKSHILNLAQKLKIVPHPDGLVTLEACCDAILNLESQEKYATVSGQKVHLNEQAFANGNDLNLSHKPGLSVALKILRLANLRELRRLQDDINDTIESIQALTANPKTDTSLGKVGR